MDRIIVKTNADMQRVIDWSAELRGMAVELLFPEGEIEFQEEMILLKFREEGAGVVGFEMSIRKGAAEWLAVVTWSMDLATDKLMSMVIAGEGPNKAVLGAVLLRDDTVMKCVRKFKALMLFSAYYREDIERTRKVSYQTRGTKKTKKGKTKNRRPLVIKNYTVSEELLSELPAPKREWHGYRESFGVRGHYRHYRSGKVVWVRPYEKKGISDTKSDREYIL